MSTKDLANSLIRTLKAPGECVLIYTKKLAILHNTVQDYSGQTEDMDEILKDDYGEADHEEEAYDNEHADYSDGDQTLYGSMYVSIYLCIPFITSFKLIIFCQFN